MSPEQTDAPRRPRTNRGRLRRSGQALVRVGGLLLAVSLVVLLVAGLTTRSLINNLRDNSAELLDGTATVTLSAGAERTLYITGGLVAPGETAPTPVDQVVCTVAGPGGEVPVNHLADDGRRVGLDNPLLRFQVVGSFRAQSAGEHTVECTGRGVVIAPEVSPADGLLRIGGLLLGSMGTLAGATLLLIGGALLLVVRHGTDDQDDDGYAVGDAGEPPTQGAEEWWEDEAQGPSAIHEDRDDDRTATGDTSGPDAGDDLDDGDGDDPAQDEADEDGYVELTDEELAAMSEEEIAELLASGDLVFVDDEGRVSHRDDPFDQDAASDTYR
ncbi:MAG: hypothetical protein DCC50_05665 [Acidobacteria bacterium]|nr:MAG: hypothetical protein DCC50_05665 [Acidobacteriota bacterium]